MSASRPDRPARSRGGVPSIERLHSRAYRLPLPRPWGPDVPCVHLVVTEVVTSDGVVGTGFSWTPTIGVRAITSLLENEIRGVVLGAEAVPEVVWDRLWWHLHEAGGGGLTTMAMAALDIALWDARGKALDRSLVDLLGRRRHSVPVYGSGVNLHYPLDELVDQARRWVAAGCSAVKIKVGRDDLDEDVERVAAVRAVIGDRRRLMVDANQRWDLPTAVRAVRRLAAYDPAWVEEPLLSDDVPAYARLRASVDIPVACGENAYTVHQFRDLLVAGACDVTQPNIVRVGGITPFRRIADLAATFGVPVMPHLLPDLSGQLAMCLPRPAMVEDVDDASFAALGALARPSGVTIDGGVLRADTRPGHGLAFHLDHLEPVKELPG